MQITRYVLPVVVGAMVGMVLIMLGEEGIHHLYPLPPGTDIADPEALAKAMDLMPVRIFYLLLANYIIASFFAGLIASLISGRNSGLPAFVIGIVLTLAGLYNIISLHHPLWFSIINVLVYIPFAYLGYLVVKKKVVT